ncbi:hypothetical protein OM076_11570 [Solirubrobacter ginsenosidimutans]|uniref:DUF3108 domain-containing protein n=1 Tax=Solirubrobacter ginsenosidimutans TaxID=490573 RepID=A0A9X3S278_9ACTN|nr:hypothetical protein [Solirubrobacter ginsenosidimutans]MDA0160906.1 hypothetical protein [Solirubrobacter ginsenosidimutans]
MTPDLLDDLKRADPVGDELTVPAALTARVLASPGPRRPRRVARRLIPAAVLVVGLAAAVLLLGRGESPSLAARAYAATGGKGIAHWRIDIAGYANGKLGSRQRTEGWALGSVTHTLHSDVHHGKVRVTTDARETAKRTSVWSTSTYRVETRKRVKEPKNNPIPNGDPLVAFRRAYRAGNLRDLGGGRFEVRLRNFPRGAVVYDIDPATGRPLRLTLTTDQPAMPAMHRPAIRSRTVLTFSIYERLPVTKANRRLLALLPHPGPGTKPASEVFAALRTGTAPPAATLKRLRIVPAHDSASTRPGSGRSPTTCGCCPARATCASPPRSPMAAERPASRSAPPSAPASRWARRTGC